jgi:hypothetical protein
MAIMPRLGAVLGAGAVRDGVTCGALRENNHNIDHHECMYKDRYCKIPYRRLRAHVVLRDARVAAGLAERVRQPALFSGTVVQVREVRVGVVVVIADEAIVVVGSHAGLGAGHVRGGGDPIPQARGRMVLVRNGVVVAGAGVGLILALDQGAGADLVGWKRTEGNALMPERANALIACVLTFVMHWRACARATSPPPLQASWMTVRERV